MRSIPLLLVLLLAASPAPATDDPLLANPAIDAEGFLEVSEEALRHRASRRVTEEQFIAMSREPGTVILDARSRERYEELHVKGAIHLSFPDMAYETLAERLPDRNVRILLYCNNNFTDGGSAFMTKSPVMSLNVPTYVALYAYGYRNVYELGPLRALGASLLEFESGAGATR